MRKLLLYCLMSFIAGSGITGWAMLHISSTTSGGWALSKSVNMALHFKSSARDQVAKGNLQNARNLLNAGSLIFRYWEIYENTLSWPTDYPLLVQTGRLGSGGVDVHLGLYKEIVDRSVLMFDCAGLSLASNNTSANDQFQSIQQRFPKISRENCISQGKAYLKYAVKIGNEDALERHLFGKEHTTVDK